jgi:formylglycine-generating enzyme required for sulfatase activity
LGDPQQSGDEEPIHPLAKPRRAGLRRWLPAAAAALVVAAMALLYSRPTEKPPPLPAETVPAAEAPQPSNRDCDACPEMVEVPSGSFLMGAPATDNQAEDTERPQRRVTIVKPFAISRHEITFDNWEACLQEKGCATQPPHEGWGRGTRPVINVSWLDAQAYVRWLSAKTGRRYRLPSEAEWEYAARAGTTTRYWWGDAVGTGMANCEGCGSRWDDSETAPAGSFAANPFGLMDVHGNVWEWVEDCPSPNYRAAAADGSAVVSGRSCDERVLRGGSWDNTPPLLRSTARGWARTEARSNIAGFRVVRE